jgi:hypothetical protein
MHKVEDPWPVRFYFVVIKSITITMMTVVMMIVVR